MDETPLAPLKVLFAAMQQKWNAGDIDAAAAARVAAPYLHGRRATVRDASNTDLSQVSDADLDRLIRAPHDGGGG
jgi:hypothetical protein